MSYIQVYNCTLNALHVLYFRSQTDRLPATSTVVEPRQWRAVPVDYSTPPTACVIAALSRLPTHHTGTWTTAPYHFTDMSPERKLYAAYDANSSTLRLRSDFPCADATQAPPLPRDVPELPNDPRSEFKNQRYGAPSSSTIWW